MTVANDIGEQLKANLQAITVANGFETDAGLKVFRGRRTLEMPDLPCIVVIEMFAPLKEQTAHSALVDGKFVIEGHVKVVDIDNPNVAGHAVAGDIMRALFGGKTITYTNKGREYQAKITCGGFGVSPRDGGMPAVAAEVEIGIEYAIEKAVP